ncbi:MAG: hypothetical protein JSR73_13265 [Proteobacteria bacterium]|nr:hypothetical protein [Pseudomonadota bacterium]
MSEILVPVSPGEVLDKITILRIKAARIKDPAKLANVRRELELLERTWAESPYAPRDVARDEAALQAVNERLWDIEDRIRDKERAQAFDAEFIALARSVYVENDERAAVKKRINVALGSTIVEEKSYAAYR